MIRLRMEVYSPYAGGRCWLHLFLHCTFRALQVNYTAFRYEVKGKTQIETAA